MADGYAQNEKQYDVAVLGAGAAGLMAAIEAGKRGKSVVLVDHAERAGKKILISGGGRCNFTNLHTTPANFLSENPHFAKSALSRYTPQEFIALVEKHGIPYHEKTLGQLFCDRAAQDVVTMLLAGEKTRGTRAGRVSTISKPNARAMSYPTPVAPIFGIDSPPVATIMLFAEIVPSCVATVNPSPLRSTPRTPVFSFNSTLASEASARSIVTTSCAARSQKSWPSVFS